MKTRAFSFVEVVLAMGIAAAIASISITYYRDYYREGLTAAVLQDLDTIRRAVELHEAHTRTTWNKPSPPRGTAMGFKGEPLDHWGNPYRINLETYRIYSFGSNGADEKGYGDDISLEYHSLSSRAALRPPHQLSVVNGAPPVTLQWLPPPQAPSLEGYRLEQRAEGKTQWQTAVAELAPADPTPQIVAPAPAAGIVYYRVVAIATDGRTSQPSNMVAWSNRQASAPRVFVDPVAPVVAVNEPIRFTVQVESYGSPLDSVTFDREELEPSGTSADYTFHRRFDRSTRFAVTARDLGGRESTVRVDVTVQP